MLNFLASRLILFILFNICRGDLSCESMSPNMLPATACNLFGTTLNRWSTTFHIYLPRNLCKELTHFSFHSLPVITGIRTKILFCSPSLLYISLSMYFSQSLLSPTVTNNAFLAEPHFAVAQCCSWCSSTYYLDPFRETFNLDVLSICKGFGA
ncbi:hypothetical protein QL093DRAFT_2497124 [Fusarium oxysporum]|nr:hypothetical protein QL093DRAFT_2497124 [Fusarium oxysporum]